ncbi:MAG TPA: 3-deoxy-D-manno-octulosonic acid transferase, partial [Gammaproteobacteria bacterium]|nr:3-deoxy-D-manno-octulosonic acid transferase [Gammaproteobacteria bacterium]
MTPTGTEQVAASFGDRVCHCYAPYDYPFAVKRFLEQARPRLLVLMETEIWPNIINHCHA